MFLSFLSPARVQTLCISTGIAAEHLGVGGTGGNGGDFSWGVSGANDVGGGAPRATRAIYLEVGTAK